MQHNIEEEENLLPEIKLEDINMTSFRKYFKLYLEYGEDCFENNDRQYNFKYIMFYFRQIYLII